MPGPKALKQEMTYQLKIELEGVEGQRVWRRLEISPEMTLYHLHRAIQAAMGWGDRHPYCFSRRAEGGEMEILPACAENDQSLEMRIKRHLNADHPSLQYIYDFGDYWAHTVTLEHSRMDVTAIPECTGGGGACPPEDSGGPQGYAALLAKDPALGERPFSADEANDAIVRAFLGQVLGQ